MNSVLGVCLLVVCMWGSGPYVATGHRRKCNGSSQKLPTSGATIFHDQQLIIPFKISLRGGFDAQNSLDFNDEDNREVYKNTRYALASVFRAASFSSFVNFLLVVNKSEASMVITSLVILVMYIFSLVAAKQLPLEQQDGIIRTSILSNLKQLIVPDVIKKSLFAPNHDFIRNFMGFSLATILAKDFVQLVALLPYFERILLKDDVTWKMNYNNANSTETVTLLFGTFVAAFLWLYKLFSSTFNVSYETMTFPLISLCLLYSDKPWSAWIQNLTFDNTLNLLLLISSFVPLMVTWSAIEKRLEQVEN